MAAVSLLAILAASAPAIAGGIIDDHEHLALNDAQTDALVRQMEAAGIATMFLLDTPGVTFGDGDQFDGYDAVVERQLTMKRRYPGRFRVFYTFPPYDFEGPRKAMRMADRGIDGLKFYNGVLWEQLGAIDSRAMYAAYRVASQRRLPVIIHVEALNAIQRLEFERTLDDFPEVTFVCPHLCGVEIRLDVLAEMLGRHRNLFTDTGPWHRVGAFAQAHAEAFRDFYVAHSDRMMFSTDTVAEDIGEAHFPDVVQCEKSLLETRVFSCFRADDTMRGLYLPGRTLDDIYYRTAQRAFPSQSASEAMTR